MPKFSEIFHIPCKKELLYPSYLSTRSLPKNFNQQDYKIFSNSLQRELPEIYINSYDDIYISSKGYLFSGYKSLALNFASPQHLYSTKALKAKIKSYVSRTFLFPRKTIDEAYWFIDIWSSSYFHWISDALPRLHTLTKHKDNDIKVLLPSFYQNLEYVQSSLQSFSNLQIEYFSSPVMVKNLKIITHTAPSGNFYEPILRELADSYKKSSINLKKKRVYISRSHANRRTVSNEKALLKVLDKYHFETVYFEKLPFWEQVQLASQAEIILSNHGAGLVNTLFMKNGGKVIELRNAFDHHNNAFFSLSSALQHSYYYLLCQPSSEMTNPHLAPVEVDTDMLKNLLHKYIKN